MDISILGLKLNHVSKRIPRWVITRESPFPPFIWLPGACACCCWVKILKKLDLYWRACLRKGSWLMAPMDNYLDLSWNWRAFIARCCHYHISADLTHNVMCQVWCWKFIENNHMPQKFEGLGWWFRLYWVCRWLPDINSLRPSDVYMRR